MNIKLISEIKGKEKKVHWNHCLNRKFYAKKNHGQFTTKGPHTVQILEKIKKNYEQNCLMLTYTAQHKPPKAKFKMLHMLFLKDCEYEIAHQKQFELQFCKWMNEWMNQCVLFTLPSTFSFCLLLLFTISIICQLVFLQTDSRSWLLDFHLCSSTLVSFPPQSLFIFDFSQHSYCCGQLNYFLV